MKKTILPLFLILFLSITLTTAACSTAKSPDSGSATNDSTLTDSGQISAANNSTSTNSGQTSAANNSTSTDSGQTSVSESSQTQQARKRMFIFHQKKYIETGETSSAPRCGVMDGTIETTVAADQIPTEELQSNFGKGYGFQYGSRENRLEVCIDHTWLIFAYHENNLDGVSMKVTQNTANSATVTITNTTDSDIQFGDSYELEVQDEKTGEWSRVDYIIDNYGFHDIAYLTEKDIPVTWDVDWTDFHGSLKPGTYRIVKDFMDFKGTGNYDSYTLMSEFTISA